MVTPDEILSFWLDDVGPKGWYGGGEELDQKIRDRFLDAYEQATEGAYSLWLTYPSGALAYIILLDQFPRNMFRGSSRAFAADQVALAASKCVVDKNWDMKIDEPARQFFYMPMMHSENLVDQDRCVRLMCARMPNTGKDNMLHAKVHRETIRRFGRFPYRNEALGRANTAAERGFLEDGGYGKVLEDMAAA